MTQPSYGPFDPYGQRIPPPQPPPRNNLLPWLIVGGAVLLSGIGILLVVLLRNDGKATPEAAPSSTAPSAAPAPRTSAPTHGGLPGGAQVADQETGGQARFDGSDQVALTWVQAMADGDYRTAYDLSCADVQQSATDAAAGGDPAQELGTYFFDQILSGQGFTDGTFDSIIYNKDADSDIASFTLQLENGEEFLLLVYVQGNGTVCDFV